MRPLYRKIQRVFYMEKICLADFFYIKIKNLLHFLNEKEGRIHAGKTEMCPLF